MGLRICIPNEFRSDAAGPGNLLGDCCSTDLAHLGRTGLGWDCLPPPGTQGVVVPTRTFPPSGPVTMSIWLC